MSTTAGVVNIGFAKSSNDHVILNIICGIFALTSTMIFSINRFLRLPDLQREHDRYSDEFMKLAHEIRMQTALDPMENDRAYRNIAEFTKEAKKRMDVLIENSPALPRSIAEM